MINPQPKPERKRRKSFIDWSLFDLPKSMPVRDEDYRQFVRDAGPCWLANFDVPCGWKPEREHLECCHLPHSFERGIGMKVSDAACACLCPVHHDILDSHVLPYQVLCLLWAKALFLRESWWRQTARANAPALLQKVSVVDAEAWRVRDLLKDGEPRSLEEIAGALWTTPERVRDLLAELARPEYGAWPLYFEMDSKKGARYRMVQPKGER